MSEPSPLSIPGSAPFALRAIVKSVQSGDTLSLQNRNTNSNQLRNLHLAYLQAPRLGSRERNDEAGALQARDFLRTMVVGREVSFEITYTIPANSTTGAPQMEFGNVILQKSGSGETVDISLAIVQAGHAKIRESRNIEQEGANEQTRKVTLREAEESAKSAGKGIWAETVPHPSVNYNMPDDPDAFLNEHAKGKKVDACVEAVNNGSTVRARLRIGPEDYQIINIAWVSPFGGHICELTFSLAEWLDVGRPVPSLQMQIQPRTHLQAMKPASPLETKRGLSLRHACCKETFRCSL